MLPWRTHWSAREGDRLRTSAKRVYFPMRPDRVTMILMKLQGASTPRPMTHDLISDLLEQGDAKCERVSVTELRDNTFFASITISLNGSELEIDSRPSDALALAVRVSAPIFAAEDVIEESAIEFEHEVEDTEEVVEKFKDFLDEVSPEDFAQGES